MARGRRQSPLETMILATTRSQIGSLTFGTLGLLMISPLPRVVLDAVTPERLGDNPYVGMMGNAYMSTAYMLLPWMRLLGFALLAIAAATMLVRGRDARYRTHLRSRSANNVAGGMLAVVLVAFGLVAPPHLLPNNEDLAPIDARTAETQRVVASGIAGTTAAPGDASSPAAPASPASLSTTFPENGTVEWGAQGQPIGGNLGRLDIWDVTGTPEDKVVKLRSGMVMEMPGMRVPAYAIVYVRSGQRVTLTLPNNLAYKVTAISGREWKGSGQFFGPDATTVDFGMTILTQGRTQVIAMGAPDQTANVVGADRF